MKKSVIFIVIVALIIMMSTSVFASSSIADQVYEKGKDYGVTEEFRNRMEKYFVNHEVTDEQIKFVLEKEDECIKIMDAAGVKDVTKLSKEDVTKFKKLVQEAAEKVELTVTFHSDNKGFTVYKNGKKIDVFLLSDSNKLVYTGSNTLSVVMVSLSAMAVAVFAVVKLRKNA